MDENPYKAPAESCPGDPDVGALIKRRWPFYYVLSVVAGAIAVDSLLSCPPHISLRTRIGACLILSGVHVTIGFVLFGLFFWLRNWSRG